MNNCERCCYFEFCTSKGRTETKDCVYGRKEEVIKMRKIKDYVIEENMNIEVVINAKGTYDIFEPLCHEIFRGLVKDIPESLMDRNVIQSGQYLRTGLPLLDIYAPDLMNVSI